MRSKRKHIYIGLLVCASLFIAILYSPIGSPDLYSNANYYASYQRGAQNTHARPNVKASRTNSTGGTEDGFKSLAAAQQAGVTQGRQISFAPAGGRSVSNQNYSYSMNGNSAPVKASGTSGGGNGGQSAYPLFSGSRSGGGTSSFSTSGIFSSEVNTQDHNIGPKRGVDEEPILQGTDPGDDPLGPPIPVPDGLVVLLLFAIGYGVMRKMIFN